MNGFIEQVIKKWKKVWAYNQYSYELQEGGYSTETQHKARQDIMRDYIKNITVFPTNDIKITYSPAVTFLEGKECRPMVGAGRGI